MKNINRAIWNAKMVNRWAFLVRNARALVDRNVGTMQDVERCYKEYSRLYCLSAYYLKQAYGAPIVDAPAVDYTVWDY